MSIIVALESLAFYPRSSCYESSQVLILTLLYPLSLVRHQIIGPQHHSFVTDKWGASEEDDHAHWDKFRRDIYLRGNPVSASAACSAAPSAYASPIATAPSSEYGTDDEESDDDESEDESSGVAKQLRRKRVLEKKRKSFKVPPNVVLMRLKERCFVNDKEGRDLSEASFDGKLY